MPGARLETSLLAKLASTDEKGRRDAGEEEMGAGEEGGGILSLCVPNLHDLFSKLPAPLSP